MVDGLENVCGQMLGWMIDKYVNGCKGGWLMDYKMCVGGCWGRLIGMWMDATVDG